MQYGSLRYLPGRQTGSAHEVTAGFDLDVFVVLGADLTKLEGGAHFTVQLILLLFRQSKLLLVIKWCMFQAIHENRHTHMHI